MNVLHCFLLLIICVSATFAQYAVGDPCIFDEETETFGVCEIIHKCEFAKKRLYGDEVKPPNCGWQGKTRVVCCPEGHLHETGVFSRYFLGSDDGIRRNMDTICTYNGYLPMICCPSLPPLPQPPEPSGCPPLPHIEPPKFTDVAHKIAFQKCVENQRFVDICEQDANDLEKFSRTTVCHAVDYSHVQRISGGYTAGNSEFPHMAVLGCHNTAESQGAEKVDIIWVGGGSLISDKFILTAGHVLVENTHGRLRYAMLGVTDKTDVRNGQLYYIARLIPHSYYTSAAKHDDIALLELDRQVKFSEFIRPICLPVPGIGYDDTRIIAGWGDVGPHQGTSKQLLKAYIKEVKADNCIRALHSKGFSWVNETMICANGQRNKYTNNYSDSCQGDSGGPLMAKVSNKTFACNYVVTGVVSWGPNCGSGDPGAYTRVLPYIGWIVNTVWPGDLARETGKNFNPIF